MKKKLIVVVLVLVAILFAGYRYLYKGHRDIASESAEFSMTTSQLLSEFKTDGTKANSKYADKTITISGKITDVEAEANSISIDGKLSATFSAADAAKSLKVGDAVAVKGRFVGYDDLLEELKLDQSSIAD